ncbi:MAG: SIMPL domain-containing protein, partial [Bacteroidia bacterium]|nr:SIMPL domain-containing protein [Bacteroidia bacterium]
MKKIILAGALLLLTIITINGQTGEKNFIDRPYIEVIGKAEMEVIPDRIYMSIAINEKDSKGKIVLTQSEMDMISKLNGLGIDTKRDLSVKDMSSNFKKYWVKSSEIMTSKQYQL